MIVRDECGYTLVWSETMQNTLTFVLMDDELWAKLLAFVHEKFPGVDTFHNDCVTFICGFESMDEARLFERDMKKRICHWIEAYT
jgi:uncharacterized protein YaeQ